jgi:membrane-associated phospholipid phosphatase
VPLAFFLLLSISAQGAPPTETREGGLFSDLLHDQGVIWSSPARIRARDLTWLLPLGGATAALIATDATTESKLSSDPGLLRASRDVSYGGEAYSTFGAAGLLFLGGAVFKSDRERHAGQHAVEAMADAVVVVELLKLATGRQRPLVGTGQGLFFKGGNSFPSGHSILAWSLASELGGEYENPAIRVSVFAYATVVAVSRFTGRNHFASDVFVGSSLGYLIGHFVSGEHRPRRPGSLEVSPLLSRRTAGIAVSF